MNFVVIITIIILLVISVIHFYWAFGGKIGLDKALPTKDEKRLINPGKYLTFIVGLLLVGFAFVAYMLYFYKPSIFYNYIGWIISTIFIVRAIGEFNAVGFFKKITSTKFAKYDTRYFSPLCLYLGTIFAFLSYGV